MLSPGPKPSLLIHKFNTEFYIKMSTTAFTFWKNNLNIFCHPNDQFLTLFLLDPCKERV